MQIKNPILLLAFFSVAFLRLRRSAIMLAYLMEKPSITGMVTQNSGVLKMVPLLALQLKKLLQRQYLHHLYW